LRKAALAMTDSATESPTSQQRPPGLDLAVKILAVVALSEAIILMTATLLFGVQLDAKVDAAVRNLRKISDVLTIPTPNPSTTGVPTPTGTPGG
jgi:hypothetical protein